MANLLLLILISSTLPELSPKDKDISEFIEDISSSILVDFVNLGDIVDLAGGGYDDAIGDIDIAIDDATGDIQTTIDDATGNTTSDV